LRPRVFNSFTSSSKQVSALVTKLKTHPVSRDGLLFIFCREEGIRTPDTLPYTRFPSVLLKPLGHLSFWEAKLLKPFVIIGV
jgi:hypothetical protein